MAACSQVDSAIDTVYGHEITSFEASVEELDTKTTAHAQADGSIQTLWSEGDAMLVTDLVNSAEFTLKSGRGTNTGLFSGSIRVGEKSVYAVYPSQTASVDKGIVYGEIPVVQTYTPSENISQASRNLMLGTTSDYKSFRMMPVASVARFRITLPQGELASRITMRTDKLNIAGKGEISLSENRIVSLSEKSQSVVFSQDVTPKSDVWMLIAPVDFTKEDTNVYFDVETVSGTYTFCRKPTRAFKPGMIYGMPLSVSAFEKVDSEQQLSDGKYCYTSSNGRLTARFIRATDTTVTVGWSVTGFADMAADAARTFKIGLFDEQGIMVVAWKPTKAQSYNSTYVYSSTVPQRFIFTGLEPDKRYRFLAVDTTDSSQVWADCATLAPAAAQPVEVAQQEGDVIAFQNFAESVWNGDQVDMAAGYVCAAYASITDLSNGTAYGDWTSSSQVTYQYTAYSREQNYYTTYKSFVPGTTLAQWPYWRDAADDATSSANSALLGRPGYFKVGVSKVRAGVATPLLSALQGTATVKVRARIAKYGASDQSRLKVMVVNGGTVSNYRLTGYTEGETVTFDANADLDWHEHEFELHNVTPTSRIVIGGGAASVSSSNNRFHIDDFVVTFKEYTSPVQGVPCVKVVGADTCHATIEWTEVDQPVRNYTVCLYRDASCNQLMQSYATTLSNTAAYAQWPARFTFPYLEPETTYYAVVKDSQGRASKPATVRTLPLAETVDNQCMYAHFDSMCWGGDYINMANGVVYAGGSASSYSPQALSDAIQSSTSTSSPASTGTQLSALSSKLQELCGVKNWSSNRVYMMQGCLLVGDETSAGTLTTPGLTTFTKSSNSLTVEFKACPFVTDSAQPQKSEILVKILSSAGSEVSQKRVDIGAIRNIPGWEEFSVDFTGVPQNARVQFASADSKSGRFLLDDVMLLSKDAVPENAIFGFVKDSSGNPIEGVVVSDGFSCTKSNSNGYYNIVPTVDTYYVYISIPENCKISKNSNGMPDFYIRYSKSRRQYDFTLTKQAVENKFTLFAFADPQAHSQATGSASTSYGNGLKQTTRVANESVPAINAHMATKSTPCYGVTLGDIVYSESSRNTNNDMPTMRTNFSKVNFPVFQTMGNHDFTFFHSNAPLVTDETSSTLYIKAQRAFEDCYGPINYSWNRGQVHIVCMRDIIFNNNTDNTSYHGGFTAEQVEWLRQDLQYVPKSKKVIVCVHIPFIGIYTTASYNVQAVIDLIKPYQNPEIFSGHTHYMRRLRAQDSNMQVAEHVHAALCGQWWYSNINGDGCPNGYGVYDVDGVNFTDDYFMGVNSGMNTKDFQLRLYRGDMLMGGSYEYLKWQHGSGVLLANVFNANAEWTIKVYENGAYTGNMTKISNNQSTVDYASDNSKTNPALVPNTSSKDWWAIGYHVGVIGRGHVNGTRSSYLTGGYHMYKYTLKNPSATVKVVACDPYGHEYTATSVVPDLDYTGVSPK